MTQTISLNAIALWFVWGFFMSLGWTLAAWLLGKVLR